AAAPGVIRILEALDQRDQPLSWQRIRAARVLQITEEAPARRGHDAPQVAIRAADLFRSAGLQPLDVRAAINSPEGKPRLPGLLSGITGSQHADRTDVRLRV